jgi:HEAT repeat protein
MLLLAGPASAQNDPATLLAEFIHYTKIAKPELAAAFCQQLLQSSITDTQLAEVLSEDNTLAVRFDEAIGKAQNLPSLEAIVGELERRITEGQLALARDPDRIENAITMLTGTQRMQLHGERQLDAAGEYAVPRLTLVITEGKDERLRTAVGEVLVDIGRQSVAPLCAALPQLDDRNQRFVCMLLGRIQLPQAAPYLMELADNDRVAAATRESAMRAYRNVGGVRTNLSELYTDLGQQYFNEAESLVANPFERTNNIWSYDPLYGLEATPVPTEIFGEVMAMQVISKALELNPSNERALGLFVAANLRRENELPAGSGDPIYGENPYTPAFYATVFGTRVCLDVLAIGIERLDTNLVRDAISALSQTTGGANLFSASGDRQPLLEALRYPDRRVQYEAALTLGAALPTQRFTGDGMVVPLLASAIRTGDESFAVVIGDDAEDRRLGTTRLEDLGFTVIAAGDSFAAVRLQLGAAVGVDLVLVHVTGVDRIIETVGEVHRYPRTAATPVITIATSIEMSSLKDHFRDDIRIKVARSRISEEEFAETLDEVMLRASGGRMTEAEAEAYAIDAIFTLRDIAISQNMTYAIIDAEPALLQALESRSGGLRLSVADILALMDSRAAQRALFDAALDASGDEQLVLLDRVAESVRNFGDHSDPRHVEAVLDLITSSGGQTAEAAARVAGSLNLPTSTSIELIP